MICFLCVPANHWAPVQDGEEPGQRLQHRHQDQRAANGNGCKLCHWERKGKKTTFKILKQSWLLAVYTNIKTHKKLTSEVIKCLKSVTWTQLHRPKLPVISLTWYSSKHKVYKLHRRYILIFLYYFLNWTVLGSLQILILHTTILIMDICKVPSPQLKALNKHNSHNIHQDGKCYQQFNKNWHII